MMNSLMKIIVSCGIVFVLTALPLLFTSYSNEGYNIEEILHDLKTKENLPQAEHRFNQYISFLERISVQDNNANHHRTFDLRYQAGQQLIERNDSKSVEAALRQFQVISQQNPSYNHGWLQFYMGEMYRKLNKWNESLNAFAAVSLYNHSRLELRARFLKAVVLKEQNMPVSSFDGYLYLRFASAYPFSDAAQVNTKQWSNDEYAPYVQSLAEYDANNRETAVNFMKTYLQSHKNDQSAQYFLGVLQDQQGSQSRSTSPHNVYSNGTLVKKGFPLSAGYSILADFYIDPKTEVQTSVNIAFENLLKSKIQIECIVNQQEPIILTATEEDNSIETVLNPKKERNHLEIRWFADSPADQPEKLNTAIQIQDIRITTSPSEPQL